MTVPFGLSAAGFKLERLDNIIQSQNEEMINQFGNVNLAPQSVFGQLIGVQSKTYADLWENLENVYYSQYPNSASGVSLDNVVALNGVTRLPAGRTQVYASCSGNEGTAIPVNALAKIPNTNDLFQAFSGGTITASLASDLTVTVGTVAAQAYTVVLDTKPFFYSLPLLTFTGSFIAGNDITVSVNGVELFVPFNTNTNTTLDNLATAIASQTTVVFSAVRASSTVQVVPVDGQMVTINFVSINPAATTPTYTPGFTAPASALEISLKLTAVINTGAIKWLAVDGLGKIQITAILAQNPFSAAVGTNLTITSLASTVLFQSQVFGAISCPVGALTQIITPANGWNAITNPQAGLLGRDVETDAQLRLRRLNSLFTGNATVEAIRSKILNVPGVDPASVSVFENTTLTEQNLVITFSQALVAGQTITVTYNGGSTIIQAFVGGSMANTMIALAAQFAALPQIASTAITGSNLILTLTMNIFQEMDIAFNGVVVGGTGTLPEAVVYGGLPAKSFEVVVVGGSSQAIGTAIWLSKPAGIESFGNIPVNIIDSQGNTQTVFYTIPNPIYLWVNVVLTLDGTGTFPVNGIQQVKDNIFAYGSSLTTGQTVFVQRVQAQVFKTPGIASAVVQLAGTITPSSTPVFAAADVVIAPNQRAAFDEQRIPVTVSP